MREIYESVHKHGDLGLPLGCVIEVTPIGEAEIGDNDAGLKHGPATVTAIRCVAYGAGGTFSKEGIRHRLAQDLVTYSAVFEGADQMMPVEVRALDVSAALQYIRRHYIGPFDLFVEPSTVIRLGRFDTNPDRRGVEWGKCPHCNEPLYENTGDGDPCPNCGKGGL